MSIKSKVAYIVATMLLIVSLSGCGTESQESPELTNTGVYDGYTLTLESATPETDDSGKQLIRVNATYKNDNSNPAYAYSCFSVRAFQNGQELTEISFISVISVISWPFWKARTEISDINGSESELIKEIQTGESLDVSYLYELSDNSDVEILIGEPTADETTIGKLTQSLETK